LSIRVKSASDEFQWSEPILIDAAGFNGTVSCKTNEKEDTSILDNLPW